MAQRQPFESMAVAFPAAYREKDGNVVLAHTPGKMSAGLLIFPETASPNQMVRARKWFPTAA